MKKTKFIWIICIAVTVLLCLVPIPHILKDGGTLYLCPIVPAYEIHIYNMEWYDEQTVKGWALDVFGVEIYENTYVTSESQGARKTW